MFASFVTGRQCTSQYFYDYDDPNVNWQSIVCKGQV